MSKERLYSKIFIIVFCINIFISAPIITYKYIINNNEEVSENEEIDEELLNIDIDEEVRKEENKEENKTSNTNSNVSSNSNSNTTNNNSNKSNTNTNSNKSNSNSTSNKTSNQASNKTSTKTSNKVSNKQSNKTSNKTTNNNTKTNTVKNPKMTYTGFKAAPASYFDDALFIGDSRTVGLRDYGNIKNASYFCDVGMSSFNIYSRKVNVKGLGTVNFSQLLTKKQYKKIYIMLGINEIGSNLKTIANKYTNIVKDIRKNQPNAIIYIEANLHVSKKKNDSSKVFTNDRINTLNGYMATLANNQTIFYIDINEYFDDSNGNLTASYTSDGVHPHAKYYKEWTNWIMKHTV